MPKQYKNIPKNIILFKVKIMPWINKTADCKILTLGKSTKYKHISEHEIFAIGTIISKCGRVIGKMGHSERQGNNRFKNIYGPMDQKLFESGVNYFKK